MADVHVAADQRDATNQVVEAVRPFLGGPVATDDGWMFSFGAHLESNWGAVYGGALAAGALVVARMAAPERAPRSLHIQIARAVPSGAAFATCTLRHSGRTVSTVEVELFDHRRKLAAIALVTMVNPDAVATQFTRTTATPIELATTEVVPGSEEITAPIVEAIELGFRDDGNLIGFEAPNVRPSVDGSIAGANECSVPWDLLDGSGPEAACLLADALVVYPVMRTYVPLEFLGPNADLTLRFTSAPATSRITGASQVLSIQEGTATVGLEVHAGDHQLAHGLSTALLPVRG